MNPFYVFSGIFLGCLWFAPGKIIYLYISNNYLKDPGLHFYSAMETHYGDLEQLYTIAYSTSEAFYEDKKEERRITLERRPGYKFRKIKLKIHIWK